MSLSFVVLHQRTANSHMSVMSSVMGWTCATGARNQGAHIWLGIRGEATWICGGWTDIDMEGGLISICGGWIDIDMWRVD